MLDQLLLPEEALEGTGTLTSGLGRLPLKQVSLDARILGLHYRAALSQTFVNCYAQPVEAVYIFPLPPGAAVSAFRMVAGERVIEGSLVERLEGCERYRAALEEGKAAVLAEQERCDVFTITLGGLAPGCSVKLELEMTGRLELSSGLALFRFPLVVAPRHVPGRPLDGSGSGTGTASDTDAAPDASRVTPPVLLGQQPDPVELSLEVKVDPLGLVFDRHQTSFPGLQAEALDQGRLLFTLEPGSRLDRDFVLAFQLDDGQLTSACGCVADPDGAGGTLALTLVPPRAVDRIEIDLVLIVDRSALMKGWMGVAACRAAQQILAGLGHADRFAVILVGDQCLISPPQERLAPASERNLSLGLQLFSDLQASGGLELGPAFAAAARLLEDRSRDRTVVLISGGQIANEAQVLAHLEKVGKTRVHTLAVGAAANHGFLEQLAARNRGTHASIDAPHQVDEVTDSLLSRLSAPRMRALRLEGLELEERSPSRPVDLYPGLAVTLYGRYRGRPPETVTVVGQMPGKGQATQVVPVRTSEDRALALAWARARVRDLEYECLVAGRGETRTVADFSLRWGVLSRFVAFIAEDQEVLLPSHQPLHTVTQPVELPAGTGEPLAEPKPEPEPLKLSFRRPGGLRPKESGELRPSLLESKPTLGGGKPPLRRPGLSRPAAPAASGDDLFGGPPSPAVPRRAEHDLFGGAPAAEAGLFLDGPGEGGGDLFGGPPSRDEQLFEALAELSQSRLWELVQAVGLSTLAQALRGADPSLVSRLIQRLGEPLGAGLEAALVTPAEAAQVREGRDRLLSWLGI